MITDAIVNVRVLHLPPSSRRCVYLRMPTCFSARRGVSIALLNHHCCVVACHVTTAADCCCPSTGISLPITHTNQLNHSSKIEMALADSL